MNVYVGMWLCVWLCLCFKNNMKLKNIDISKEIIYLCFMFVIYLTILPSCDSLTIPIVRYRGSSYIVLAIDHR